MPSYMVLAEKHLKAISSQLIHVTCVVHGIHRICEIVKEMFPDVNRLISCARKILLKCPARIALYQEKM